MHNLCIINCKIWFSFLWNIGHYDMSWRFKDLKSKHCILYEIVLIHSNFFWFFCWLEYCIVISQNAMHPQDQQKTRTRWYLTRDPEMNQLIYCEEKTKGCQFPHPPKSLNDVSFNFGFSEVLKHSKENS